MELLIVFAVNFAFIFLKAFQQLNVFFKNYKVVPPTSFSMTITQVYIWHAVSVRTVAGESFWEMWPLIAALALAGWLGSVSGMYLHHRYLE